VESLPDQLPLVLEDVMRTVGDDELLSKVVVAPESSVNDNSLKRSMVRVVSKVERVSRSNLMDTLLGMLKWMILSVCDGDGGGGGVSSTAIDADGVMVIWKSRVIREVGEEGDELDRIFRRENELASIFIKGKLKSVVNTLEGNLAQQVKQSLRRPFHHRMPMVEARLYFTDYEEEFSSRDSLFKLAKLYFKYLELQQKEELRVVTIDMRFQETTPYIRDRVPEIYLWISGLYFEPRYSLARIIATKITLFLVVLDDIYDAYATIEEIRLLTDAINKWDISAMEQIPKYIRTFYKVLLDEYAEIEKKMAKEGRANIVIASKEAVYMITILQSLASFRVDFKTSRRYLMTYQFERERGQSATGVDAYIKTYGVSEKKPIDELKIMIENAWKDINEGLCNNPSLLILVRHLHSFFPGFDHALMPLLVIQTSQILSTIAEKVHQEKVQQEKIKAVKARLNFKDTSQHSESRTLSRRRGLKERLGPRHARSMSGSPEPKRDRSKSPRERGPERKTCLKGWIRVYSTDLETRRRVCLHTREIQCIGYTIAAAERLKAATEVLALEKQNLLKRISITKEHPREEQKCRRKARVVHEDIESQGRRGKSQVLKMTYPNRSHIETYDISEDLEDHLKIFQAATKTKRWAMPTWCHMFNSTLTGNARVWFDDLLKKSIDSYDDLKEAFLENYLQQKKCIKDPVEIHNIKQRDEESTEDFVRRYKLECRDVKGLRNA
nr:germacrene A synthase [Tanacetum cinerariifolium]